MDKQTKFYYTYIFFMAIAGLSMAVYITLPYGAGISSDAMRNLAVAANVYNGKGFFDFIGSPFLWWPPLYPLTLVFLAMLTRLDVFIVGWLLNVFVFGVNIWLSGVLFQRIFTGRIIYAYLNTFVVFLSLPMLKISTNIASDPLFITFILLWLILWGGWNSKWNSVLPGLTILAALATCQRLLGVILIGVGGLLILIKFRNNLQKGVFLTVGFGIGSCIPLAGWLIGHNYLQYHTFFGPRNYHQMVPLDNLLNSSGKILDWFFPYYSVEKMFPYWYTGFILIGFILLLINNKATWWSWLKSLTGSYVAPGLFFSIVYFAILMYTIDSRDQKYLVSDRYQVVILFTLLTLISLSFDKLILPHISLTPRKLQILLITLCAIWSIYPFYNLNKYISSSRKNGESSYNLYNTRAFNESPALRAVKKLLESEPDAKIYSNIPGAVWFFTRHSLNELIPIYNRTKDEFKEQMAGWPYDKPGYIIWFEPDPYKIFFPPKDLLLIADLKIISKTSDGIIFSVTPRAAP